MSKFSANQTSFNAGVLSSTLKGNVELERYAKGLDECENFIALKQGPLTKRSGTLYISDAKNNDEDPRLEIFEYNGQTICLEFGENYIRFYEDGARVEDPPGTPYEVVTTYTEAEVQELDVAQNLDKLYIAHKNHAFAILTFTSSTSWSLDDAVFESGPYLDVEKNTDDDTDKRFQFTAGSISNIGDTATLTSVNFSPFVSTDVGRLIRLSPAAPSPIDWGTYLITSFTDSSNVEVEVLRVGGATDQTSWAFGAYSDTTGHPSTVTFHQSRLVLGGGNAGAETAQFIFGSRVNKFLDFTPTQDDDDEPLDDDGYRYKIASDKSNEVLWAKSAQRLFVGTPDSEYALSASNDGPLTPTDIVATRVSRHGSSIERRPLVASNGVLFIQRSGRKLRTLDFDVTRDGFTAPDVSQLSEDLTSGGLKELDYQQEPYTLVWAVRGDGSLTAITYDPLEEVIAFHEHTLGGTDVRVISVASGQSRVADRDEVYLLVERTVDSSTVVFVEYLNTEFLLETDQTDAYFVDAGITYDGVSTTTITGLDHLEGETVKILADGAVRPELEVTGGQIELSSEAEKVHVGLGFTAKFKTLPPEVALPDGSAQARKSRHYAVGVRVLRSLGFKVGPDESNLETVTIRRSSDPMSAPVPLFTGVKEVKNQGRWKREDGVLVVSDNPTPLTVLSISRRMHVNEP